MDLFFDWSGTLADDQEATYQATAETLAHFGGRSLSFAEYRRDFRLPVASFYAEYCPGISLEAIEAFFTERCAGAASAAPLFPGAESLLHALSLRNRLFLLSTLDPALLEKALRAKGLGGLFQGVHGGAADKTRVLPKLLVLHSCDPLETFFVGDTPHDLEAARAAGIPSAAVTYGYTSRERLEAAGADHLAASPLELLDLFDEIRFQKTFRYPLLTVGGLLFDGEGRALFIRTSKWGNRWGTPGGKVQYGETLEEAFAREMREETGLRAADIRYILHQDCIEHPEFHRPRHFLLLNYIGSIALEGPRAEVRLNYESQDHAFATLEEALRMDLNQPTRVLVEALLREGLGAGRPGRGPGAEVTRP